MAITGTTEDPLRAYHFTVEVRDLAVAHFASCSGIEARVHRAAYRSGGDGMLVHQLPTMVEYSPCVLRWGVSDSTDLQAWMELSLRGRPDRREVSIIMLDPDGSERRRYNLAEAWPCAWRASALDAMSHEVAIETMEITYTGLTLA